MIKRKKSMLSKAIVRELLDYDPRTGVLTWRSRARKWFPTDRAMNTWNTRFASKVVAQHDRHGYQGICILKKWYYAHRVAFLWMTGRWPCPETHHVNHDKSDNRWINLREVSYRDNNRAKELANKNSRTGVRGVSPFRDKFQVTWGGRYLGTFSTIAEAVVVRDQANSSMDENRFKNRKRGHAGT